MTEVIPRFRLALSEDEIRAVEDQVRRGELAVGHCLPRFEEALRELLPYKHCAVVSNGFAALHLGILACGIRNSRILLPAASTCFSMLNAVRASGNQAEFIDLDGDSANLSIQSCEVETRKNDARGIISPNHFGVLSDIAALKATGTPVIEDAAQSIFSTIGARACADLCVLSFYPTKGLCAVDGGAVLTNSESMDAMIRDRRYYDHQESDDQVGRFNYRLPDLHAAMGLAMLRGFGASRSRQIEITTTLSAVVRKYEVATQLGAASPGGSVHHKFVLRFPSTSIRNAFRKSMQDHGVSSSIELLALTNLERFPTAARLIQTTASIPIYPSLTASELRRIKTSLDRTLRELSSGSYDVEIP